MMSRFDRNLLIWRNNKSVVVGGTRRIYYENASFFGPFKGVIGIQPRSLKSVAIPLRSTNQYQTTSQLCVFCDPWSRVHLRDETSLKIVTEMVLFTFNWKEVSTKFRYKSIELIYTRRSLVYILATLTDMKTEFYVSL